MQSLVDRGCGLDVDQATVVTGLLSLLKNGKVQRQIRRFGSTTRELVSLREWSLREVEQLATCVQVVSELTVLGH